MSNKSKYYVVWKGVKPGIYYDWDICKAQISGFAEAKYKSFESKQEAELAFKNGWEAHISTKKASPQKQKNDLLQLAEGNTKPTFPSISVDAACSGNPGVLEYQGVDTATGKRLFHYRLPIGTNNIGEFLAIVHALAMLKKSGRGHLPIYSDSRNAINWVKNKETKTSLERSKRTEETFQMLDRAVAWLKNNTYQNPILKWETEIWGEIPADFGRK